MWPWPRLTARTCGNGQPWPRSPCRRAMISRKRCCGPSKTKPPLCSVRRWRTRTWNGSLEGPGVGGQGPEMDERRTLRVSVAVQEELTEIIGFELDDPRLLEVTVTEAHVSPDGRYAHVKVALGGDERQQKASLAAL